MKPKTLALMCVALGCGVVAMLGVKQFMNKNKSQEAETVDVLVATMAIDSGVLLDETNTEFKAYPVDSLVEGVVTTREQVEERSLKANVFVGDFILESKLGNKGDVGVASQIPPGMRVVSLKVDATTSHSGLMLPGHRVDVMCTFKKRGREGMVSETKTVLQFCKVFATDNVRDAGSSDVQSVSSKNVSLLVTPEEATKFLQAKDMSNNNLHLALRSNSDTEDTDSAELDDNWLWEKDQDIPAELVAEDLDIRTQLQNDMIDDSEPIEEIKVADTTATQEMWSIEIFEGDQRRVEEVPLPVVEEADATANDSTDVSAEVEMEQAEDISLPMTDTEATGEATTEPPKQTSKGGIGGIIQSFFSGA